MWKYFETKSVYSVDRRSSFANQLWPPDSGRKHSSCTGSLSPPRCHKRFEFSIHLSINIFGSIRNYRVHDQILLLSLPISVGNILAKYLLSRSSTMQVWSTFDGDCDVTKTSALPAPIGFTCEEHLFLKIFRNYMNKILFQTYTYFNWLIHLRKLLLGYKLYLVNVGFNTDSYRAAV